MTHTEAASFLREHDNYLILTHKRPDGDTIGCAVALCLALRKLGKTAAILPNPDASSLFVPYFEHLTAGEDCAPDTVVSVDVAAVQLFHQNARKWLDRGIDLAIDHHPSQEFFAGETCLDAGRAACGELMYDILKELVEIDTAMADALYVAVSTDTGCFVYGNVTAGTHRVAAALMEAGADYKVLNKRHFRTKSWKRLQLESALIEGMDRSDDGRIAIVTLSLALAEKLALAESDIEDIAAVIGVLEGVEASATIRELRPGECKISLRTSAGLNASKVCGLLGGGGHAAAAGCTVGGTVDEARAAIKNAIRTIEEQA